MHLARNSSFAIGAHGTQFQVRLLLYVMSVKQEKKLTWSRRSVYRVMLEGTGGPVPTPIPAIGVVGDMPPQLAVVHVLNASQAVICHLIRVNVCSVSLGSTKTARAMIRVGTVGMW